jgi:hypothetical protein
VFRHSAGRDIHHDARHPEDRNQEADHRYVHAEKARIMRENGPYNADAHHHNYHFGAEYKKHLALSHQQQSPSKLVWNRIGIGAGNIGTQIKAKVCHGSTLRKKILKLAIEL